MKRFLRAATLAAIVVAMLSACASPYAPYGATGGYTDRQIDDNTFEVSFKGNGKTPEAMVWNYWIYRCAEVTSKNGFRYFAQMAAAPKTSWNGNATDAPSMQKTRYVAPTYIYVPGGTTVVRTWRANAVIRTFKPPMPESVPYALDADVVMAMLKDYVSSGGSKPAPTKEELLQKAAVRYGKTA
jgi:hypothetical protein